MVLTNTLAMAEVMPEAMTSSTPTETETPTVGGNMGFPIIVLGRRKGKNAKKKWKQGKIPGISCTPMGL
jgi:hypothetical protein